jgi:uncharacterized protein (DUF58 family)
MLSRTRTVLRTLIRQRSTRLTADGLKFLLFTLAIGVAAINTGNNLFYLLLATMLSLILVSGVMAEQCLRRLEFHRHVPELLFVKEPAHATVAVLNRKSYLPSFSLRVFDAVAGKEIDPGLTVGQVLPGARRFLSYPLTAMRRGQLPLNGFRVATRFPFGLFLKQRFYPVNGSVIVCPEITSLESRLLQEVLAVGVERSLHRRGHGYDLYNLRAYQTGDDSRSIHWVTTARTSKLIVRETEAEDQQRATLVLSTVAPPDRDDLFEEAVTCTASLAHLLSARGYQIRLVAGTQQSSFGQGDRHLMNLLQILALCERCSPEQAGEGLRESLSSPWQEEIDGAVIALLPWEGLNLRAVLGQADLIIDESLLEGRRYAV